MYRELPSDRYYAACEGSWAAPLTLVVTEPTAVLRAMGLLDGLGLLALAWWPRWLGRVLLHTTVQPLANRQVRHTTTVRWLGLPVVHSNELLSLEADGVRLRMHGTTRMLLMPWRRLPVRGSGQIAADASRATYRLEWMGAEIIQESTRLADTVELSQSGPGYHARESLQREC